MGSGRHGSHRGQQCTNQSSQSNGRCTTTWTTDRCLLNEIKTNKKVTKCVGCAMLVLSSHCVRRCNTVMSATTKPKATQSNIKKQHQHAYHSVGSSTGRGDNLDLGHAPPRRCVPMWVLCLGPRQCSQAVVPTFIHPLGPLPGPQLDVINHSVSL